MTALTTLCDCVGESFLHTQDVLTKIRMCVQLDSASIGSRGARDSKIGKKWPESSRILDYNLSVYGVSEV